MQAKAGKTRPRRHVYCTSEVRRRGTGQHSARRLCPGLFVYSRAVFSFARVSDGRDLLRLSPNGSLQLTVDLLDTGDDIPRYTSGQRLYYRVHRDSYPVLEWSPLGLELADRDCVDAPTVSGATTTEFSRDYTLVAGKQKRQ
jgi:hypothetical protein